MDTVRVVVLIAATISMGFIAGAFFLYAHAIMPGLARTDDRTFVGAFQALDRGIVNPWFMVTSFMGALVFTAAALFLHLGDDWSAVLPWVIVALVLYAVSFVMTIGVNVPLNDALKAAGDPDTISDLRKARTDFNEPRWNRFNLIRTVLSSVAFGCLAWALVEFGHAM